MAGRPSCASFRGVAPRSTLGDQTPQWSHLTLSMYICTLFSVAHYFHDFKSLPCCQMPPCIASHLVIRNQDIHTYNPVCTN